VFDNEKDSTPAAKARRMSICISSAGVNDAKYESSEVAWQCGSMRGIGRRKVAIF
jgi:hypothetical protein